jgi:hypothetical protein
MRTTINILALFVVAHVAFGQSPDWSVNNNAYEHTMTFVAFLNIDGQQLASTNDKLAAFVGDECRGVCKLTYIENRNRYYAYLVVYGNSAGDEIKFKVYDSERDQVKDIPGAAEFEIGQHYGDLFQGYCIASPALSKEAEIIDFEFTDTEEKTILINNGEVTIDVLNGVDISSLVAQFQLSIGTSLYDNYTPQVSGVTSLDYGESIELGVLSEDESILKLWKVKVNVVDDNFQFFKKDAVCYNGGAIKVIISQNDFEVAVYKDEELYATQNSLNGEVLFTDLSAGSYKVQVGAVTKVIQIELLE